MAKEPKKKKEKKGGRGKALLIFGGLFLACIIKSTFLLLVIGLLPSVVAYYVDVDKEQKLFRTVMVCNLAGVLPYVADLVARGNKMAAFHQTFFSATTWFIILLSAGAGWALHWGMPHAVKAIINGIAQTKVTRIHFVQNRLLREWGPEIQR